MKNAMNQDEFYNQDCELFRIVNRDKYIKPRKSWKRDVQAKEECSTFEISKYQADSLRIFSILMRLGVLASWAFGYHDIEFAVIIIGASLLVDFSLTDYGFARLTQVYEVLSGAYNKVKLLYAFYLIKMPWKQKATKFMVKIRMAFRIRPVFSKWGDE